jgi:hypothetical protein
MQAQTWRKGLHRVSALVLCATAGCTVTFQPWSKHAAPPPPVAGQPVEQPGSPYPPGILPTSGLRPPMPGPNSDSMVQLIKQLNEAEDNRKALQDQVQTLRKQLKDREENLRQASYEMEESSKQVKRTRDDFRQWQAEMEELRERIRKLEDGRAALRPLIEDILQQLDRDRDAHKLPIPPRPLK